MAMDAGEIKRLIEADESAFDIPLNDGRGKALSRIRKSYDTSSVMAVAIARQMLNSQKVYNDD